MLGVSGERMDRVLEAVLGCSVLVQGCWVVSSHVLFPESNEAAKRNARDYIVRILLINFLINSPPP